MYSSVNCCDIVRYIQAGLWELVVSVTNNLSQFVSSNGVRWCLMEYKCDLRKEDKSVRKKNCILSWDLTAAGSKRQNLAFLTKMLLLNNLCMILPRYWTVFQKKEAKILKVFIWEIMIKRILWYAFKSSHIMKYSREPALIIQLKVHNRLAFEPHTGILYILDVFCLKSPPPPVCSTLFSLTKPYA